MIQQSVNPTIDNYRIELKKRAYQYSNSLHDNRTIGHYEVIGQRSDISHEGLMPDSIKRISTEEQLNQVNLRKTILVLRAVNNTFRQKIMNLLNKNGSMTVTEIYSKLRMAQSFASQHLSVLRKAGIVITKKNGRKVTYSLNKDRISYISTLTASMAA